VKGRSGWREGGSQGSIPYLSEGEERGQGGREGSHGSIPYLSEGGGGREGGSGGGRE
jgi:hypothetical protein